MTRGKKISGIKIHIGVDILGLPHCIHITQADVTERAGALDMFANNLPKLSSAIKVLCDGGYTGETFSKAVEALIGAEVEVAKRSELHKFTVIPKRWVVERTFAWLDHFRRLWKNCERKLHTTHQMVTLALISLLLHRY
jgi:transposase